ncbi:Nmad2 family putative nucleotide modification protein [Shewanella frigidimarina]|uniref:Nmad2 family putative nucleotide modification protein n=1 Tax=Shewanella frigidimarina TaxID=56812 RepID=UPI003F9EEB40
MLITPNSTLFAYVITRDFGFAPNPFYGNCTLATCKPKIRKGAKIGDWILGVGGRDLGTDIQGKCILLMKVSEKMSFEEYWNEPRFALKKPCRNGSPLKMLGDNIYHRDCVGNWIQEDSHHSNSDGTTNNDNLARDTGDCDQVLVSNHFFYFGNNPIPVDLGSINYKPGIGHKKIPLSSSVSAKQLVEMVYSKNKCNLNCVMSDPCQFLVSHQRVNQNTGIIY